MKVTSRAGHGYHDAVGGERWAAVGKIRCFHVRTQVDSEKQVWEVASVWLTARGPECSAAALPILSATPRATAVRTCVQTPDARWLKLACMLLALRVWV